MTALPGYQALLPLKHSAVLYLGANLTLSCKQDQSQHRKKGELHLLPVVSAAQEKHPHLGTGYKSSLPLDRVMRKPMIWKEWAGIMD